MSKKYNYEARRDCYILRKKIDVLKKEIYEKETMLGLMQAPSLEELEQEFEMKIELPHDDEVEKWYKNVNIEKHFRVEKADKN
tara:strand:+ start:81 stop:329 length:249 start_codon:yes stop_codon:yes gene_type:complete